MKAIKLFLIACLLIGTVIGLLYFKSPEEVQEPEFVSEQANEWKNQINQLCKETNWSIPKYEAIKNGIHMDKTTSHEELINDNEERILLKYLFSLSCSSLFNKADEFFKAESYSETNIEKFEQSCNYLNNSIDMFGKNSNLTNLSTLLSEYKILKRSLGFSSRAEYSRPLKKFSAPSAQGVRNRINRFKYYSTHFSKNVMIARKIDMLDSDREHAESDYYEKLELLIEKNYKQSGRIEELLEDQIIFNEMSTNSSSINRLTSFVNDPDK